jgi:NAD(P)-dependent dehydrogenase (short-subunit alcohol dehydrogenase family)
MKLDEKVAIVTGGTKGIGFAIASELVRSGSRVYVCARDRDEVEDAVKRLSEAGEAYGKVCDVREETQVMNLIVSCESRFGGVDILINNAGVGFFGKTVEEMPPDEFRKTIETNVLGMFYACHYAIPLMKKRGGGYIINISSLAGQNAHPRMAAYNASKFALNGFTESLMQEVRHDNIKVSYVCPGSVNTEFGGDAVSDEKAWQLQPDDIARVVMNLLAMDARALPSKIEIRPSKPPIKQ